MPTKKTVVRQMPQSAITGRIVTAAYAASHPKTTIVNRVVVKPKGK